MAKNECVVCRKKTFRLYGNTWVFNNGIAIKHNECGNVYY